MTKTTNEGGEKTDETILKAFDERMTTIEGKQKKKATTDRYLIIALIIALTVLSITNSPEAAEPILSILKSFLYLLPFSVAGFITAISF